MLERGTRTTHTHARDLGCLALAPPPRVCVCVCVCVCVEKCASPYPTPRAPQALAGVLISSGAGMLQPAELKTSLAEDKYNLGPPPLEADTRLHAFTPALEGTRSQRQSAVSRCLQRLRTPLVLTRCLRVLCTRPPPRPRGWRTQHAGPSLAPRGRDVTSE